MCQVLFGLQQSAHCVIFRKQELCVQSVLECDWPIVISYKKANGYEFGSVDCGYHMNANLLLWYVCFRFGARSSIEFCLMMDNWIVNSKFFTGKIFKTVASRLGLSFF